MNEGRGLSRATMIRKRYKKGRPLWWNQCDREVGSSGGFAPRPPKFNASVPVRKLWKGKRDPLGIPLPSRALSQRSGCSSAEPYLPPRPRGL
jgi:hypothetical protein